MEHKLYTGAADAERMSLWLFLMDKVALNILLLISKNKIKNLNLT